MWPLVRAVLVREGQCPQPILSTYGIARLTRYWTPAFKGDVLARRARVDLLDLNRHKALVAGPASMHDGGTVAELGTSVAAYVGMRHLILLALLIPAACVGQSADVAPALSTTSATPATHTVTNPAVSFERFRTFSFGGSEGPPRGYEVSPRSAQVRRLLQPFIAAALTARGYIAVPEKGDVVIMFGSGRRELSVHEVSGVETSWLPDDENQDFVEGALVIDAFDGVVGVKAWHGATQANIDPGRVDERQLQRSVQTLIASFPAKGR
jgi:hypothetical protein